MSSIPQLQQSPGFHSCLPCHRSWMSPVVRHRLPTSLAQSQGLSVPHSQMLNRLAIGARIKIVAGGVTQTDEIHSGGSNLSQNVLRVHFGLGSATKVESVEIRWPSGATETLKNLAANKFYSVLEGKGSVPPEQIRPTSKAAP
jgi:hypothetical protein